MLAEFERKILREAIELVRKERRAPKTLRAPIEPTWTVLLASNEAVHVRETQHPGDEIDAVTRAWEKVKARIQPEEVALYLTLEPNAFYQRIAPVTEAIRRSGIKRVIVGAEDPFLRSKGKGIETLRRQGCTVVLADGEEARECQLFYSDYEKAVNRFLPQWTIAWELFSEDEEKSFQVRPISGGKGIPSFFDVTCAEYRNYNDKDFVCSPDSILVLMDSFAGMRANHPFLKQKETRFIEAIAEEAEVDAGVAERAEALLRIPKDGERIDLGKLARQIRDLSAISVVTLEGAELWHELIRARIADRVLARVHHPYNVNVSLVNLTEAQINLPVGEESIALRLINPGLIKQEDGKYWVEAQVIHAK